jgi:peptidoglycan/xylan/chitin deacetylase (PgdA/CDA1 family)
MVMDRPLVLAYHAISSAWETPLAVREEEIRRQLTLLKRRGYQGFTFHQAELLRRERRLPPRAVVVTFDDGFASVLKARPILAQLRYPATVFVVAGFVEGRRMLSWPGMEEGPPEERVSLSWDELLELTQAGWEIGAHTMSHPLLSCLDDAAVDRELIQSRQLISRRLGGCISLAYPYGVADDRVAGRAQAAGYAAACVLRHSHRIDDPYRRPRVNLARGDGTFRLALKFSTRYLRLRRTRLAEWSDTARTARCSWLPTSYNRPP